MLILALALPALALPALAAEPPPAAPDLAGWAARLGVALPGGPTVQVQPLPDGVAFVGEGVSLRLIERGPLAPTPEAAIARELAAFTEAGLSASPVEEVACAVVGAAARCHRATLTLGPGATMAVTAGGPDGADWLAVCLDRRGGQGAPCAGILGAP